MLSIISVLLLMALLGFGYNKSIEEQKNSKKYGGFLLAALVCFSVKVIFAILYYGHFTDMDCFSAWSGMLAENGLGAFYESDAFTDYPPGYMYILYFLGLFKNLFNIGDSVYYVFLKMPAVFCDILTGYLIYKTAKERFCYKNAIAFSCAYMLNPAVIVNSSMWGQVDSIYTLGIVITLLLICHKKLIGSFFAFAVCVFIKPQSLIFTPVLIFAVIKSVFIPKFDRYKLLKAVFGALGALMFMVLMALPFGLSNVLKQYVSTIGSYPYMTVNAFNIWGAMGQNWTELTPYFEGLGTVFIILITVLSARVFFSNRGKARYFMTAAFLIFSTFMMSVKMHDRYAFPVMAMLLFAFIFSKRKEIFSGFVLTSMSQFFNMAWVLFIYEKDINYYAGSITIVIASVINIFLLLYLALVLTGFDLKKILTENSFERKSSRLKRSDLYIILCITAVYSIFAFYNLGSFKAPKTSVEIEKGQAVEIELEKEENIKNVFWYLGADAVESDLTFSYYNELNEEVLISIEENGNAFYWNESLADVLAKKIILSSDKPEIELFEVVLKNENGIIPIKNCNYFELTDEQDLCPERVTFRNSTYFDEIYHARTGYEFVNGKDIYEWTHPPLGKVFIAMGIKLFGMTPFGWRIIGTLFGILMIFVIYALLKRIFKESFIASVGCILLTFDFMHFTQTRIATIDVYVTFFIMLMYYFMYKYYVIDFNSKTLVKSFKPLLLAGISFGFGAASKWTACYACAGLAVIFFITVWRRYRENKDGFFGWFIKTALFCVLAFIIIPIAIYCISYIPYMNSMNDFSFSAIWENQVSMFTYHSDTVVNSTHDFASRWYSWPIMYRPIWYYSGEVSETVKEGISAFGNPVVWWLGIPSFVICAYFAAFKRDKKALFLLIGYLANLLPWVFVERTTYIYHYFPCTVFSVLMISFCVNQLDFKYKRYAGTILATAAVVLFLMFYPVLSGAAVPSVYVDEVLRWMGSWVLIS